MGNTTESYYLNKSAELQSLNAKLKKKNFYFYIFRLCIFFIIITFLFLYINNTKTITYLFLCILSFITLLIIVKLNIKLKYKVKYNNYQIQIIENELNYLKYNFNYHNSGEAYFKLNPNLSADFDLYGNGSLFQFLNRTSTKSGEIKFAESLCKSEHDTNIIKSKQQVIKELSLKTDFLLNFRTLGTFLKENGNELENIDLWINQDRGINKILRFLAIILPIITLLIITLIILNIIIFQSIILPVSLNLILVYINLRKINLAHSKLNNTSQILKNYIELLKQIENEDFKSEHLCKLKNTLQSNGLQASRSLQSLFKLLNAFDFRLNIIVAILLNSLFIFDIQLYCRLNKWKKNHKSNISLWFKTLAEFDSLLSYSIFAFNYQNELIYPELSTQTFKFEAIELGHPLIKKEVRVSNNFTINGKPSIIIITGANMAGKSTFLRSISINLILAMNGAPVCAKNLIFNPCDIMSSIKIQDSLFKNESYFYAELLRLKEVINHADNNPQTIIFLDEILRGTNTKDKQNGTMGLLEKLISQKSIAIIATHDLSIGELEKKYPDFVKNYCFEVELTQDQLIFDYKLKNGISNKLNASFLMRKMGIIS